MDVSVIDQQNNNFAKDALAKAKKKKESEDNWTIADIQLDDSTPFSELSTKEKVILVLTNIIKVCCALGLLYLFICSLDLLSSSFRLISGKTTSDVLSNEYIENPVVGLMIGILVTVLVQSSSTSTSIIVSMVAAEMLEVRVAIPMIMGSNIGTSVTNTIVSLTQVANKDEFRRAFAGATVHDMFNWLSVIIMMIIEVTTGMLFHLTEAVVDSLIKSDSGVKVKLLKHITEPTTNSIIMLDKRILECWGMQELLEEDSMIKKYCDYNPVELNETLPLTTLTIGGKCDHDPTQEGVPESCSFLFSDTSMSDTQVGVILLVMSLGMLCLALIIIVKILNSMLKGSIAKVISKTLNADVPYIPWITGYIAILVGAVMTFIVQSSSIFTSTLTPLIGLGIITVDRSYPLTLGSNIGTTTTTLLASMAGDDSTIRQAIQIALVHLFFNIFGIMMFYPIPFMRFPIPMCKILGNITAEYRWFAVFYLVAMFFLLPGFVFMLSLGGAVVMYSVIGPIVVFLIIISIINTLQSKKPHVLPKKLQNWDFLPLALRSLQPYDRVFTAFPCCKKCRRDEESQIEDEEIHDHHHVKNQPGFLNPAFTKDEATHL